jgi:predicted Zn-dependent protease
VRAQPPVILAPRDSRVLPGGLNFEWTGSDRLKYRVRLLGPQGNLLWEQPELDRKPLAYPAGAPALTPGVRYTWELDTKEHGVQRASFDVAQPADAARVKEALASLTPATAKGYPPATLSLMRAGLLFQETLYADARRELVTAIATDPEEPTLHLLLGHVYDRIGLKGLAANEFDEAEALTAPKN